MLLTDIVIVQDTDHEAHFLTGKHIETVLEPVAQRQDCKVFQFDEPIIV